MIIEETDFYLELPSYLFSQEIAYPSAVEDYLRELSIEQLAYQTEHGDTLLLFLMKCYHSQSPTVWQRTHALMQILIQRSNDLVKMAENLNSTCPIIQLSPTDFLLTKKNKSGENALTFGKKCLSLSQNAVIIDAICYQNIEMMMAHVHALLKMDLDAVISPSDLNKTIEIRPKMYGSYVLTSSVIKEIAKSDLLLRLAHQDELVTNFGRALATFSTMYDIEFLRGDAWAFLLKGYRAKGVSLLHHLIMRAKADESDKVVEAQKWQDLEVYLRLLDTLYQKKELTKAEYLAVFTHLNGNYFMAIQQAVNAPNLGIACTFLDWFKDECSLENKDKLWLLTLKNKNENLKSNEKIAVKRAHKKYGFDQIRKNLDFLKSILSNHARQGFPYCHRKIVLMCAMNLAKRNLTGGISVRIRQSPISVPGISHFSPKRNPPKQEKVVRSHRGNTFVSSGPN